MTNDEIEKFAKQLANDPKVLATMIRNMAEEAIQMRERIKQLEAQLQMPTT